MREQAPKPDNQDPNNESGRISRTGTSAGISIGNDSSSGGADPVPPGGDKPISREELARERRKPR
ncbi:MAG TPA: hypothetical protein VMU81_09255 [Acetobacteraceae bacterium]|nr:hypothetical protein [Acetobacteraceae bacterium]